MIFIEIIFTLVLLFFVGVRARTILTYFQQDEYDGTRFFNSMFKIGLYDIIMSAGLFLAIIANIFGIQERFCIMLLSLLALAIASKELRYVFKKKLVLTERAKRIYVTTIILTTVLTVVFRTNYLATFFIIQSIPVFMIFSNSLLRPYQKYKNQMYIDEAMEKLNSYTGSKVGITGSFGKTTVKGILAYLLSGSSIVFYSPGSINTILGLTRHIRQRLQPSHEVFIAEMGAYGVGSIQRLCEFIEPNYGVVTSVGNAHSERFGSIESTAQAKSELVKWVCEKGVMSIIPVDLLKHDPFRVLYEKYQKKILICGHDDSCDIQIHSTQKLLVGWKINISFNYCDPTVYEFKIPLFGNHNHMNFCLSVALCHLLNPDEVLVTKAVAETIPQTPHRLQVKSIPNSYTIIDDAYNSNKIGFKNAIDVLKDMTDKTHGKSVLITPGIAELGEDHDLIHAELGKFAAKKCDEIYIVNSSRIPTFLSAIREEGFSNYQLFNSFNEAKSSLSKMNLTPKDVVLFENDLPDLLEVRRLL